MIMSMTGFGTADGVVGTQRVSVEIRSVNHRFFNPSVKLPSAMMKWEGEVRELLRRRIARGHVSVSARAARETTHSLAIDTAKVGAYVSELRAIRDQFGLAGDVDLTTLLRLPDVFAGAEHHEEEEVSSSAELMAIVQRAADALDDMRRLEGTAIADFLAAHLAVIEERVARIRERAPQRLIEQRDRIKSSVAALAEGAGIDQARLAQEVAVLADRMDISEELNRFGAHIAAFRAALAAPGEGGVGKRLGFLIQELLREANTTGSKASDAAILDDVVAVKEELERLREQSENVE